MVAYRTVMVGTDGSESSYAAVEGAARLAAVCAAELLVVCAYLPLHGTELARAQDQLGPDGYQVVGSAPAEDTLRTARERAHASGATKVRSLAVEGEPVPVLVRTAQDNAVDLLVVGNRGLRSLAGRLLGSVPADIARKAGLDVLIVHTT
ncbi:universal stress protein [Streptomyces sp. NPDC088785]|uniref:universal stress protein n=1 Tax=Streptomyces sp. NPDC088785 TaxID=3365897 RepID=UPI00381ADD47